MVTGFGRFMSINDNATGRMISKLVPGAVYPETTSPPAGNVDPPGPQLNVASTTLVLPESGLVDVCSMILPVYWDLASILIAKEMEAFEPTFVMMNGVAGFRVFQRRRRFIPEFSPILKSLMTRSMGSSKYPVACAALVAETTRYPSCRSIRLSASRSFN